MDSRWCNYAVYNRLTNGENAAFSLNGFETVNNLYENVNLFQQQNNPHHQPSNAHLLYTAAVATTAATTTATTPPVTETIVSVPVVLPRSQQRPASQQLSVVPVSTTSGVNIVAQSLPTVISHSNQVQSHQYFPSNSPFGILPHHFHQKPLKSDSGLSVSFAIADNKPAINLTRKATVHKLNNVAVHANSNLNSNNTSVSITPAVSTPIIIESQKKVDLNATRKVEEPKSKVIVPVIEDELTFLLENPHYYQQPVSNNNNNIMNNNKLDDKKSLLLSSLPIVVPVTKTQNFFDTYLKFINENSADSSFGKRKSNDDKLSKKSKI